ncbi:phosphomannomutase/phosphoglucomutase [Candidatus Daviesbacteria bacterium]|nr:phosphomannomutase/phosphoglucomutase [Candidatus Daviesbacteria bacterium]
MPPEKIFKSYDIRGIYPSEINEENIISITKAIFKLFQDKLGEEKQLKIVVGRDMRLSSPALFEIVTKTLVNLGAEVIDIGLSPTTTFYFAVFEYGYDCGIQITASHNPKDYNGMKMVINSSSGLIKIGKSTGMEDIKKYAIDGVNPPKKDGGKITVHEEVLKDEAENALKIAGNPKLKTFKIVSDAANAMAALYLEELFKIIPGNLIKMNFNLDGTFPAHPADPLDPNNVVDLQKRVLAENADLGIATDGDGDRLFFVDEQGEIVPPTIIISIVSQELLKNNPGETILVDIRYLLTPQKNVEESGGKLSITKVGHAFITEKMYETGAIFAGESSAHYFFKATGNGESQLPVVLSVLKKLTETDKKLSEVREELKRSYESGEINFRVKNASEIMEKCKDEFNDGEISTLDGVAISFPTWRFSLRTSNTEPLLRLNLEALDENTMRENKEKILGLIEQLAVKEEGSSH